MGQEQMNRFRSFDLLIMTRLQKGQQYFQVEEITPKNRVFNALSLKLSHYDDKVGDFSFASRKNSVFAVESIIQPQLKEASRHDWQCEVVVDGMLRKQEN